MNITPLVSVIVPVYQGERFVRGAIRSVVNQTHQNLEILVVDDGSTDGTWDALQQIQDPRIRLFRQANGGAANARNLALRESTGQYIAFLDADDRWLPTKLADELAVLRDARDGVGIAYSWYYAVDDDGRLLNYSRRFEHSGNVFDSLMQGDTFVIPSVALFHRAIFDRLGGFDAHRRYHEDAVFIFKACHEFPAYPTRKYAVIYKQTLTGKGRRIIRDFDLAVESAISVVDDLGDVVSEAEKERVLYHQLRAVYFRFLMYGFNRSARRLLPQIDVATLPGSAKGWVGWIFARSGINLMLPIRLVVQGFTLRFRQRGWRRLQRELNLT